MLYLLTDEISSVLVRGQLGYLIEHRFDVTVASGGDGDPKPDRWDAGVTVERLPFVREPSPFADARALVATMRLIRRLRPHAVNASTPKAGLIGMLAAWMCRVPRRIYVVRGLRFETATGWRRRVYEMSERAAMRLATTVVFNSASLRRVAERDGVITPGRGLVLGAGSGNGIDVRRFSRATPETRQESRDRFGITRDSLVVGFVGRFTRDKGIADLAEAFVSIRTREAGAHLLLVGMFEDGDAISEGVRASIESDRQVVMIPWVDDPAAAYRAMDVLAFPSAREGLPNVPLEAQLCAVPVVAYATTGTVDALVDGVTGVLVPHGDAATLAGEIVALLGDPGRRATLGAAGAEWVTANFDQQRLWAAIADLLGGEIGTAGTVRSTDVGLGTDGST